MPITDHTTRNYNFQFTIEINLKFRLMDQICSKIKSCTVVYNALWCIANEIEFVCTFIYFDTGCYLISISHVLLSNFVAVHIGRLFSLCGASIIGMRSNITYFGTRVSLTCHVFFFNADIRQLTSTPGNLFMSSFIKRYHGDLKCFCMFVRLIKDAFVSRI